MKQIWISQISRAVDVSDRLYGLLSAYKIMWPPETTIRLGKKVVKLKDFELNPPPEQVALIDLPEPIKVEPKRKRKIKDGA